jgi:hypothetical protein
MAVVSVRRGISMREKLEKIKNSQTKQPRNENVDDTGTKQLSRRGVKELKMRELGV